MRTAEVVGAILVSALAGFMGGMAVGGITMRQTLRHDGEATMAKPATDLLPVGACYAEKLRPDMERWEKPSPIISRVEEVGKRGYRYRFWLEGQGGGWSKPMARADSFDLVRAFYEVVPCPGPPPVAKP